MAEVLPDRPSLLSSKPLAEFPAERHEVRIASGAGVEKLKGHRTGRAFQRNRIDEPLQRTEPFDKSFLTERMSSAA